MYDKMRINVGKIWQSGNRFRLRINEGINILELLFIAFCMMPYLFPNPIVGSDTQPYAALLGTVIVVKSLFVNKGRFQTWEKKPYVLVSLCTLFVAVIILIFSGINISGFRAFYNYYAVAIIPWATLIVMKHIGRFPEELLKCLILTWFAVASIQFFVYRGFATEIISGARWDSGWRGVLGLASEPSFFGIACFYFLHFIQRFKKHKMFFFALALVMCLFYAQSAIGIIFIIPFVLIYILDANKTLKGLLILLIGFVMAAMLLTVFDSVFEGTRLQTLIKTFMKSGIAGLLNDPSGAIRFRSILEALSDAFGNYLLPMGFAGRIGSGYGGFLCELGFLALPVLCCISWAMSMTFKKKAMRVLYFVVISLLLLNNTQIGNPLLLFIIGVNLAFRRVMKEED